jgi:segregation and condensation protein B
MPSSDREGSEPAARETAGGAEALEVAEDPETTEALAAVQAPEDNGASDTGADSQARAGASEGELAPAPASTDAASAPTLPEPADGAAGAAAGAGTPAALASLAAMRPLMEGLSLPAQMEAILYLKGRPLGLGELAEIAGVDREQAELGLITLMADYAHRDTALEIRQEGSTYSLQLRESLGELVQNLLPVDLSTATLRTLATIALKKRILQSELVELRGSGAYDHIKELLAQDFIERKRQSEGRSYWLSLSEKFHRTFSVQADGQAGGQPAANPRRAA